MISKDAAARDRRGSEFIGMLAGVSADITRAISVAPGGVLADVLALYITEPRTGQ